MNAGPVANRVSGGIGVDGDTAVAPESDRNCDRDQLTGFRIELTGFLSSAAHRRIAPDRL